jgi:hypothetical protein
MIQGKFASSVSCVNVLHPKVLVTPCHLSSKHGRIKVLNFSKQASIFLQNGKKGEMIMN